MTLTPWIAGLAMLFPVPALVDELPVPSVWENQSGSVFYIDAVDAGGHFIGRYINGAAGYRCQGIEYDVEGRVFAPLITFNVVWRTEAETCHTITSWTGVIEGDVIDTQWSLVRWNDPGSDSGAGGLARFDGTSQFERRH